MAARQRCTATTKAGKRCRRAPRKGSRQCAFHDPTTDEGARFGSPEQAREAGKRGGRPPLPRPHEMLRERVEDNIDRWLEPLEAALTKGRPVVMWSASDAAHRIEHVADPELGMKALKLALEHVYGRPRQQQEHSGLGGEPIELSVDIDDPEVREIAHRLLRHRFEQEGEQEG